VSDVRGILQIHDMDLLEQELSDAAGRVRLRKIGLALEPSVALAKARQQAIETVDRRWTSLYERAYRRYGRGVCAVRDRVCQGCHITLPTSKTPSVADTLTLCESCSRLLYWG
jgi:predicted  nucleic acid-binding Zn-ribbon protein